MKPITLTALRALRDKGMSRNETCDGVLHGVPKEITQP